MIKRVAFSIFLLLAGPGMSSMAHASYSTADAAAGPVITTITTNLASYPNWQGASVRKARDYFDAECFLFKSV